ncbi:hypothetical protein RMSM_03715 [Rhodopirellula maiorica SM1]|uniref:Uncharacterized protein n=1 Tax=Rhodopirellula maiorica SM1 TaxID=1265738 RepID=M5RJ44_9BACT|nr:hypothetical protein RMSM_03715 [Rhodopirellula maiorica SM1]
MPSYSYRQSTPQYYAPSGRYSSGYRGSNSTPYPSYGSTIDGRYYNNGSYYGNNVYGNNVYGNGYYGTQSQQRGAAIGGAIGDAIGGQRGGNIGAAIGNAIGNE